MGLSHKTKKNVSAEQNMLCEYVFYNHFEFKNPKTCLQNDQNELHPNVFSQPVQENTNGRVLTFVILPSLFHAPVST